MVDVLNTYYNYLSDDGHRQNTRQKLSSTQPSSIINLFYLCELLRADVVYPECSCTWTSASISDTILVVIRR